MNLKAPIYFSTGLTEKANHYYKLFITWTNQKIRKTFVQRNMFEFKHIKAFDRAFADNPGPMVRPGFEGGHGHLCCLQDMPQTGAGAQAGTDRPRVPSPACLGPAWGPCLQSPGSGHPCVGVGGGVVGAAEGSGSRGGHGLP